MFIGREKELADLNALYNTDQFQMPVIYGRRRVGKSTLILQMCDKINIEGKILYVSGNSGNFYLLTVMNQYELMLNKTIESSDGNFATEKSLENKLRDGKYTYIYIYRFDDEIEKIVKNLFEDGEVKNDTLYEIIRKDDKIILKRENI